MLLVIDVGNTNIVLGVYNGNELTEHWRLATSRHRTADEYGIMIRQLFAMSEAKRDTIHGAIISCVSPPMLPILTEMVQTHFHISPVIIGPGVKTGMPILYENPREVGADRIVNAVAAYARAAGPCIVVDFGTATTFDAVSAKGEYMGGVICPGVTISAEALSQRASKLPRIEIMRPACVIGRNTETSMQAGLAFGYGSLVDGLVDRIVDEYGQPMRVIATGGLSSLFAEISERIDEYDANLTLEGLRILYARNQRAEA